MNNTITNKIIVDTKQIELNVEAKQFIELGNLRMIDDDDDDDDDEFDGSIAPSGKIFTETDFFETDIKKKKVPKECIPYILYILSFCSNFLIDYLIHILNYAMKIKYLDKIFTAIFGNVITILIVSLFASLNEKIIPFETITVDWNDYASVLQQFSIFFTFLSFITSDILFMRVVLILSFGLGIISMVISAMPLNLVGCSWYLSILLINMKHTSIICYDKRHITFEKNHEIVYNHIFKNLLKRSEFVVLMKHALVRQVKSGTYYVNIGDNATNLSILIDGRLVKTDQNKKRSFVQKVTFIDSPEFLTRENKIGNVFTVSFYCETDCKIIMWARELIESDLTPQLHTALMSALGIDVAHKFIKYSL